MQTIAQTPRLIIREFAQEDEAVYLDLFEDEEVNRYLPKRNREERSAIYRKALENYGDEAKLQIWGIFDKAGGTLIGMCLLRPFSEEDVHVIELGYSLAKDYWGTGLATEMATTMVAYGFEDARATAIVGVTDIENTASQRVLEKAGLSRMENIFKDGQELAFFKLERGNG